MKKFIWVNGTDCKIIERKNMNEALKTVQNLSNHSKEIILREIKTFTDYSKIYTNIN